MRGRGRGGARGGARGGTQVKVAFTEAESKPIKPRAWLSSDHEAFIKNLHTADSPDFHAKDEDWREWYEKDGTLDEWKKYCRESMPPELLHSRCEGCLQHGHSWDLAFSKCLRRRCCYCGNQFRNKRSHPASLCPNRPADAAEAKSQTDEGYEF